MKIFEDKTIKINLSTLIDSRQLLCANSGGGKSYAIRKLLEEAGSDVMSIILDVEGELKTLREKYDFLLIGQTGDVPISVKAAHLLPQKLMELHVSTIIDISDLKMHERILYVKKFLDALMELPRKYWQPCLVVVDEAHMYCGQQEKQESTHAVIDLMTRGRKRGFCGILATQRIAKLHKDAAAEANNYMIGRTGLDIDMKRAAEILGFTSKVDMLSLRNLKPGEFYVFGTAISRYVKKAKVSKVRTTHPKVGMDLRGKITPPTQKIKAMLSKLTDLPKEAEEKAKTTAELRRQNRELKRKLSQRATPRIDEKQLEIAEKRGRAKVAAEHESRTKKLNENNKHLADRIKKIADIIGATVIYKTKPVKQITKEPPLINIPEHATKHSIPSATIEGDTRLGRCERAILSLLYNNPEREFTKTLIGVFTGYSHKSGGFNNALCHLNSLKFIRRTGKVVLFNSQAEEPTVESLGADINLYEKFTVDNWAQKLPKCAGMIFQFLKQHPDTEFTKEDIGENTGYSFGSGGFANAICRLNSLGLIIRVSGKIKLNSKILE